MSDPTPSPGHALTYPQLRELVEKEIDWHLQQAAHESDDPEQDYRMAFVHHHQSIAMINLLYRMGLACAYSPLSDGINALSDATNGHFKAVQDAQLARKRPGR
ncbi:hypothetical protein [Paraburkholderia sp. J10-1]|uniref:hypothetical protein n=1 Tax=Paraburkholderia sp. J10-1 TaxID=2805430 RepID=UPI002AB6A778|nr:hypothetical protein [Paraburkholderia sp. J10-1]